jgi:hypothetical protein
MTTITFLSSNSNIYLGKSCSYLDNLPELLRNNYELVQRNTLNICSSPVSEKSFDWKDTQNAFQRIIHLADLPDKWDGYGAPKFSRHQINRAIEIFQSIQDYSKEFKIDWGKIEPFIAPSSDGSILFEWSGKRFDLKNLEIYVPLEIKQSLEYLKTDIGLNHDTEGEFQASQVSDLLDWLVKI